MAIITINYHQKLRVWKLSS